MTQPTRAADRTPEVGHALGHYRLIGMVGDGSLGRLYVAEQRKIRDVSNTVALRCIRADLAEHPDFHSLFAEAASVVPRLEHPNILSIHEMNEVSGNYFFSMEYLPGENVASILTRCDTDSPVPADIAASIVKQAANAAQYFRDIAASVSGPPEIRQLELGPSNLFVTYHGTVKWLAVGLRPASAHEPAASGERVVNGWSQADAYRAPEHIDSIADARSDVFSLGALLWTLLTGHRPHLAYANDDGDAAALGRGVAPSSLQPDVPEALDMIVMRALSLDPGRRFQSPREMSETLDRYLLQRDGRPTHKHMRRWMEQLFDAERMALQLQIAKGRKVEAALASLSSLQDGGGAPPPPRSSRRARELWSTRNSVFSRLERGSSWAARSLGPAPGPLAHEPLPISELDLREAPPTFRAVPPRPSLARSNTLSPEPAARPRTWMLGAMIAVGAIIAGGTALILSSSDQSSPLRDAPRNSQLAERSGQLEIRSTPEGAAVFVDGEPTGLRTPAVLKGLAAGRSLRLRVEKAGFASQEREVAIEAGSAVTQAFDLLASAGLVHFAGVPADAHLFIDDGRVAPDGKPVSLSIGQHAIRVETQGSLMFSGTVVVIAGEQTIRLDGAEGHL